MLHKESDRVPSYLGGGGWAESPTAKMNGAAGSTQIDVYQNKTPPQDVTSHRGAIKMLSSSHEKKRKESMTRHYISVNDCLERSLPLKLHSFSSLYFAFLLSLMDMTRSGDCTTDRFRKYAV